MTPDGTQSIKDVGEGGCKYLGILNSEKIKESEMKGSSRREYLRKNDFNQEESTEGQEQDQGNE